MILKSYSAHLLSTKHSYIYLSQFRFQLSSIPEVSAIQAKPKAEINPAPEVNPPETSEQIEPVKEQSSETEKTENSSVPPAHPEYDRFIKMVSVGVPLEAVKLKVSLEGLDPNVFAKLVSNK